MLHENEYRKTLLLVKGGFTVKPEIVNDQNNKTKASETIPDRSAVIEDVIRRYADMIYRIAYQNTSSFEDAEDILQEVSIALVTKDAPLDDEVYLKRWLIRVTINKCRDLYRLQKTIETVPLQEQEQLLAREHSSVMEEIQQLPEMYRTIIYLYYYENYTLKEIAATLRKSINTVSSGLQRARKKLRNILTEEDI